MTATRLTHHPISTMGKSDSVMCFVVHHLGLVNLCCAAPGSNIVTPSTIRADLTADYQSMQDDSGWVQGADVFAKGLIVEQNRTNPNRVDVLYPAILINQLRIFALLMQFSNIVPASEVASA